MRKLSKLKVCFLAGTLEHGGAERQLVYMLQALCQEGAAPRVLCLQKGEFWEARIRSLGVPVTWVGQSQSQLARLMRVIKEVRADLPDVLQSQHFFANAYVGLASRLLRICGIGAMRNGVPADMQKCGRIGGRLNLRIPRYIAANSKLAIRHSVELGVSASRLYFLPNVVDTARFRPSTIPKERPLTLLSAGRIVKEKGFDRFISALGRLRFEFKLDVRGCIVGPTQDKELRRALEARATMLRLLPDHLQFLDGVPDMGPLYQRADICVLTSDYEGTPNVLLEAMASGVPVVATKVGGVPDIVLHGETGLLVERDDMDGLTKALAELVTNEDWRREMGRCARELMEMNHSPARLPDYLEGLYALTLPTMRPGRMSWMEEAPGQPVARPSSAQRF